MNTEEQLYKRGYVTQLPQDKEATVKKITNLDPSWCMRIENRALCDIPDNEIQDLIENLDIEKYLELFKNGFEKNWRNITPGID